MFDVVITRRDISLAPSSDGSVSGPWDPSADTPISERWKGATANPAIVSWFPVSGVSPFSLKVCPFASGGV